MNWFDWCIVAFLGVLVCIGFIRGLVQAVAGLVCLVLAVIAAVLFFQFGTALLIDAVPNAHVASVISFLVIAAVVYFGLMAVLLIADKIIKLTPVLSTLNRLAGAVVTFLQGGIGLAILQALLSSYPIESLKPAIEGSVILDLLSGLLPILQGLFVK